MKSHSRWQLYLIIIALFLPILACSFTASDNQNASSQNTSQSQPVARRSELDTLAVQIATPTLVSIEVLTELTSEDQVLINLYQRVNPSVVNIEVTQRVSQITGVAASGSGFVYDTQGHIITNAHVIEDATEVIVTFNDGFVTTAEVIGADEYSDLAVIRVDVREERLVPITLGDSSQLLVGQGVVAIGNPFGLQGSMTRGIISALGRALPSANLINQTNSRFNNPSIIQVDATVNPGNSGGPLLNWQGEVIGINTAIRTESGTFEGVAFAVPVNTLKRVAPQLIENRMVRYSWLGVATFPDNPWFSVASLAEPLNLPVDHGIIIDEVMSGSPAEAAGLRGGTELRTIHGESLNTGGDIIVAINNVFVYDLDDLLAYLVENTSPDDVITLTVIRGEETLDIDVTLGVRP